MDRQKIEDIRTRVSCATVLTQAGFRIDRRESSRGALKFRRDSEIIIVTHGGAGWFDPLSDRKGDVFALVTALEQVTFPASVQRVGELAGVAPIPLPRPPSDRRPLPSLSQRWSSRPVLVRGSPAYTYLHCVRSLPPTVLQVATLADAVRQGPHGSAWFRHDDGSGKITGWEERGAEWRGFSTGGTKTLFRFGKGGASYRICITEAAIDALSLAAIEDVRADTLYASTGGGWSPNSLVKCLPSSRSSQRKGEQWFSSPMKLLLLVKSQIGSSSWTPAGSSRRATPKAVLDHPCSPRLKQFLASLNLGGRS